MRAIEQPRLGIDGAFDRMEVDMPSSSPLWASAVPDINNAHKGLDHRGV